MKFAMMFVVVAAIAVVPAQAETVFVEVTGFVEYNQVWFGAFADVNAGDPVRLYFEVDSDNFVNSSYYPTRGYLIDPASYSLTLGSVYGRNDGAYPSTPYFVLRDNDPAVDGFFDRRECRLAVSADPAQRVGKARHLPQRLRGGLTMSIVVDPGDIFGPDGFYDYDGLTNYYFTVVRRLGPMPIGLWWQTH